MEQTYKWVRHQIRIGRTLESLEAEARQVGITLERLLEHYGDDIELVEWHETTHRFVPVPSTP
jgi:hypothetical protein